jgi:nucleoside-diphosphate-sugar epimerase
MSRILVTGITSPLGQAVGRKLQAEGHRVVGTLRSSKVNTKSLPADYLIALDLETPRTFLNINEKFDAIVHVAGMSVGSAPELMQTTGLGTYYLTKRACEMKISRIVHISSMAVYALGTEEVVGEHSPIPHGNPYHVARWAAECYIRNERQDTEVVSIRSPAIVGSLTHNHFLSKVFADMISQKSEIVSSNPNFGFNNVVHEEEIAIFVNTLISHDFLSEYRAVPIGSSEPLALKEILQKLAERTNYQGVVRWVESKSPPFRIDSTGAIELGYKPITTLETISRWMHDAKI